MKFFKWIFGTIISLVFVFFILLWIYRNFDIHWLNWLFEKLKIIIKK